MKINLAQENIELTDAIQDYAIEKFGRLPNYMENLLYAEVRLGKDSKHHEKGNVFHCRVTVEYPGGRFMADKTSDDLYKAINECKEALKIQISEFKDKKRNH